MPIVTNPMSIQEQSSTFSSTTSKSVQVIQSGDSTNVGVGELFVPPCGGSNTATKTSTVHQKQISSTSSSNKNQQQQQNQSDLSNSTSASSISSDNTLRDISRMEDFSFRPTFMNFDSLMASNFEDVSRDLCPVDEGKNFEVKLDVQDYKPEEIQVKISDNLVTIAAKQEVRQDENNFRTRQFSKKFTIPQGVKAENITCNLTAQGVLKISAPIEKQQSQYAAITSQDTSNRVQQQQQNRQVSKVQQQESVTSSRKSSINSDISSIRDFATSFDDEFVLRPRMDLEALMSRRESDFSQEIANANDGKKFEMKLEVKEFKAEEIEVKITKNLIKIEGKHESQFASRSFYKEFTIPHGVKANTIQCSINTEGVLTISAPIQQTAITSDTAVNKTSSRTEQVQQKQVQQQRVQQQNVQQQQVQQQTVQQQQVQQQQVQQKQQELTSTNMVKKQQQQHSDSNNSIRDTVSKRLDDFILRPIMDFDSLLTGRDSNSFEDVSKQICHVNEGNKFEMKLDVPDFKPEELQVKITNNMVTIEGKQETEFSSRSFFKKFSIPQGVKPETIESSLSPKGVLTISAPIQNAPSNTGSTVSTQSTQQVQQKQVQQQQVQQQQVQQQQVQQQQVQQQQVQQQQVQQQQVQQQQTVSSTTTAVRKEQQIQQQQQQQRSQLSDSNTSIRSDQDYVLRPVLDMNALVPKDAPFEDISKEICQVNDGKKFETKLQVPDFKPEELEIKISNNMVTITGKQETEFSSRSFFKKFSIPAGVKPETISSSLSPSGILTVSAPVDQSLLQQQTVTSTRVTKTETEVRTGSDGARQQQTSVTQQQQTSHSDNTNSKNNTINQSVSKRLSNEDLVLRPILDFNSLLAKDSNFEDISKELCQINDGKKFEMKLDVPDFKPEELTLKISNNLVTIQGKQEMKQENNFSSRSFCKKFSIPEGVKPENITSSLSPKGVLTISAPIEISTQNTSNTITRQEQQQLQQQQQQLQQQQQQQMTSSSTVTSSKKQSVVSSRRELSSDSRTSSFDSSCTTSNTAIRDMVLKPKMNFDSSALTNVNSNFEDVSKEICHVNDGQHFEMKLAVQEFRPEEIEVKISNNLVTIEGKQEMREENNFRSRQFCKKFTIPAGVKPENISCSISTDGNLTMSAPVDQSQSQKLSSSGGTLVERGGSELVSQQHEQSGQTSTSTSSSTKKVSSTFSKKSSTVSSSNF